MHDLFEIRSAAGSHPVRITDAPLAETVRALRPDFLLADTVFRDALAGLEVPVLFLDAIEDSKQLAAIPAVLEACRAARLSRSGHLVALGGGVIQDIAGFVASIYMRGLRWSFLPTTLLAMVDSCIGGKSSINVGDFKNLAGTFHPPSQVLIAPDVLATLPAEHLAAGRAEAAKICYAGGAETFDAFLAADGGDDPAALIALSLRTKKWFVEVDEFDRGERLLLNFGHSYGHAIETCTHYAQPHGLAVGVGCLAAVAASRAAEPGLAGNSRVAALEACMRAIVAPVPGVAEALAPIGREAFFRAFDSDKKHMPDAWHPILLGGDAALYRATLPRGEAAAERLWRGFEEARADLSHRSP